MIYNVSLVLEGGGMRGAYTAGVLDFFMDKGIHFPLVVAASSAALVASSYVAKQRDNNFNLLKKLMKHRQFISIKRLFTQRELVEMGYVFDEIPNRLLPFDFDSFVQSNTEFVVVTTDKNTGQPVYFNKYDNQTDLFKIIRASNSLPVLAPSVSFKGQELLDGGVADPIPITPSIERGYKKHVVVLTRNKGYIKRATKLNWFFKLVFNNYPGLRKKLKERHLIYNRTMDMIKEMEERNEVLVIQPEKPLIASRFERNNEVLHNLYHQGYQEAAKKYQVLLDFFQDT